MISLPFYSIIRKLPLTGAVQERDVMNDSYVDNKTATVTVYGALARSSFTVKYHYIPAIMKRVELI